MTDDAPKRRKPGPKDVNGMTRVKILELRQQRDEQGKKLGTRRIAKMLGLCRTTVCYHLRVARKRPMG